MKGRRSWLYAAYSPTDRLIKIGYSTNPAARMTQHSTRNYPVILLAKIPGGKPREFRTLRRLRAFRAKRHSGEWFHECPEVMLVVSEMLFIQHTVNSEAKKIDLMDALVKSLEKQKAASPAQTGLTAESDNADSIGSSAVV